MGLELPEEIATVNPVANLHKAYGPYADLAAANAAVPASLRAKGLTVGVIVGGKVLEYWWNDSLLDSGLIPKVSMVGTPVSIPKFDSTGRGLIESSIAEISNTDLKLTQYAHLISKSLNERQNYSLQAKSGTLAHLDDIIPAPVEIGGGYAVLQANTPYLKSVDPIVYYINPITGSVEYYGVEKDFTSSNPLVIATEITNLNIIRLRVAGSKIEEWLPNDIYFKDAGIVTKINNIDHLYIAKRNNRNKIPYISPDDWKLIGFYLDDNLVTDSNVWSAEKVATYSDALAEGKINLGDVNNKKKQIPTVKIYHIYVGDVLLNEAYLLANQYNTLVKLGCKVESLHQVAERTLSGWIISKKNPTVEIVKDLDVTDTDYFTSNTFKLADYENADVVRLVGATTATTVSFNKIEGLSNNSKVTFEVGNSFISLVSDTALINTTVVDSIIMIDGSNLTLTQFERMTFVRKGSINFNIENVTY